jgi:hypothetical protein
MSQIKIQDKVFQLSDIKRLYPAALVATGDGDEVTQISLEWLDTQEGGIEAVSFAIFLHLNDGSIESFTYKSRELLEEALQELN